MMINKPFVHLKFQAIYDELREGLSQNYFEGLIKQYMIDNTHCSLYLLCPSKGLAARKEQALADKLAKYKASLSEEEQEQLITATAELKQYQSEPSPKEILETIPLLTIDDIRREAEPIYNKELSEHEIPILQHEIRTNGIAYVDMLFDIHHIAC